MDDIYKNYLHETGDLIYDVAKLSGFTVDEFNQRVYDLLNKDFKGNTIHSNNTQYLGNNSLADLLLPALVQLEDHSTRSNNPHRETTTSIGTMTVDEINNLDVGEGIRSGLFPLDVVGYDTRDWIPYPLNEIFTYIPANGGSIKVNVDFQYSIYATPYVLSSSEWIISEQCPNWPSTDVYMYIGLNKGFPSVILTTTKVPDTLARIYMATLNKTSRTLSNMSPVIRMSGKRFSTVPVADGLPVSAGNFLTGTKINSGWFGGSGLPDPVRPTGLDFTISYIGDIAGNGTEKFQGNPIYPTYIGSGGGNSKSIAVNLSNAVENITWTSEAIKGIKAPVLQGWSWDNSSFSLVIQSFPVGTTKFTFTAYDSRGESITKVVYLKILVRPTIAYLGSTMPSATGSPASIDSAMLNGIIGNEYFIDYTLVGDPDDYTLSWYYSPLTNTGEHRTDVIPISTSKYKVKFLKVGTGRLRLTMTDVHTRTQHVNVNIRIDSEGPPVYNPKFTAITATGARTVLSGTPNLAWYNSYKNMGVTEMPYVKYEIEFQGIGLNYTFGADTLESLVNPGFKGVVTKVLPNKLEITMIPDYYTPPPGKTVQYLKMAMILKNGIGTAISDHYYLRFIHG